MKTCSVSVAPSILGNATSNAPAKSLDVLLYNGNDNYGDIVTSLEGLSGRLGTSFVLPLNPITQTSWKIEDLNNIEFGWESRL